MDYAIYLIMKKLFASWDDVIFENRNKEYGAFIIRKSYISNTLIGAISAILVTVIIVVIPGDGEVPISVPYSNYQHADEAMLDELPLLETDKTEVVETPEQVENADLPPVAAAEQNEDTSHVENNSDVTNTEEESTETDKASSEAIQENAGADTGDNVESNDIYFDAEVMPQYPDGQEAMKKFIETNLQYPQQSKRLGMHGTVFVQFVVTSKGKLTQIKVLKGISEEYDREAVRIVSLMPLWKPGTKNKIPVAVRMVLPIRFQ